MYGIDKNEGLRQQMARLGAFRGNRVRNDYYNTGCAIYATDACSYLSAQALAWGVTPQVKAEQMARGAYAEPLSTGASRIFISMFCSRGFVQQRECDEDITGTPAAIVKAVREAFALNVSDLAEVFRVTRPTVYQWMKLDDFEQVRSRHDRERLKQFFRLVRLWTERGSLIGRWKQVVLPSGKSILDLLATEELDTVAIMKAHAYLADQRDKLRKTEHERGLVMAKGLVDAFAGMARNHESLKKRKES